MWWFAQRLRESKQIWRDRPDEVLAIREEPSLVGPKNLYSADAPRIAARRWFFGGAWPLNSTELILHLVVRNSRDVAGLASESRFRIWNAADGLSHSRNRLPHPQYSAIRRKFESLTMPVQVLS